ncbi:MAG TPA: glycosyltransferase [Thermoanaerobaculia bacterium]|nr:glycosyltransferase [Thermoanaerobaculia bacterium]
MDAAKSSREPPPSVSIVVPAFNEKEAIGTTLDDLSSYLSSTGLSHEIIVVDDGSTDGTAGVVRIRQERDRRIRLSPLEKNQGKGAAVRKGMLEARGEVVAFLDADLPYQLQNLGNAMALVQSGATDIAIGARDLEASESDPSYPALRRLLGRTFSLIVRTLLVPEIPDTQCGLKVFSAGASRVLFGESKVRGFGFDFEVLFLARKYGFRIERIPVSMSHRHASRVRLIADSALMLRDVLRVRYWNRVQAYRAARRCPVCFSSEVFTLAQIRGWVVRTCSRCKCRYLGTFPSEEELETLYNDEYFSSGRDGEHGYASRELTPATRKTNERRLAVLRRHLASEARLLEVGAGNGLFGEMAATEFDYVGIDLSEDAVRAARGRGLEVYRASLSHFVNTGSPFDAVTLFHVFEHLADPHDALATISELLKPGGIVLLITPDTESLLCALSGDRWVSYKFPEHLILYSRSALIELLEHSGFEIVSASSDFEFCEHEFLAARLSALRPLYAALARPLLSILPDPIPATSGSIRIVARRRSGPPVNVRAIRAVEPTHAR